MTLTELRYAVAVAKTTFRAGRRALFCQPAQPLVVGKELEEELGVELFERGHGEVLVTPSGERVVEQARRTLEEADRIRTSPRPARIRFAGYCGSASSIPSRRICFPT